MKSILDSVLNVIRGKEGREREALRNAYKMEDRAIFFDRPFFKNQEWDNYFNLERNPRGESISKNVNLPNDEDETLPFKGDEDNWVDEDLMVAPKGESKWKKKDGKVSPIKESKGGKLKQYSETEIEELSNIDPFSAELANWDFSEDNLPNFVSKYRINPYIARAILDTEGVKPYREKNNRISVLGIGYNKNQTPSKNLIEAYKVFENEYIKSDDVIKNLFDNASPEEQYAMAQFLLNKPAVFRNFVYERIEKDLPVSGRKFIDAMFDRQREYYTEGNVRAKDKDYRGEKFVKTFKGLMNRANSSQAAYYALLNRLNREG
jgi:hypothetical protein